MHWETPRFYLLYMRPLHSFLAEARIRLFKIHHRKLNHIHIQGITVYLKSWEAFLCVAEPRPSYRFHVSP